ncbi:MAG: NAD(+)/NADH kinase [Acidimicrobiales bacterium]
MVVQPGRGPASSLAGEVRSWLDRRGHMVEVQDRPEVPRVAEAPPAAGAAEDSVAVMPPADLAISLGGDGTMLRTVKLSAPLGIPVLGINLGRLGYLTEVEPSGWEEALVSFFEGGSAIDYRMMLAVTGPFPSQLALNEAVVERAHAGHTVRLSTEIGEQQFLTYLADGLIVATPTGSTAYNLSVGGPVLSPDVDAMLLTPVSPHMVFRSSIVVSASETISARVSGTHPATLVVDGQAVAELAPGEMVTCTAAPKRAALVSLGGCHFHQRLKAKFSLMDR